MGRHCRIESEAEGIRDAIRVEQRIDQAILIEVAFRQRLAQGVSPELARLDHLEVGQLADPSAERVKQANILPVQREAIRDALRGNKVADSALDTVDSRRQRCRSQMYETLLPIGIALESERIEPAGERSPAMEPTARP